MPTFEIRTVETERFVMDYIVFGSGERPFVILPGIGMKPITLSAPAIAAAYADFAARYTVYVFDRKRNIGAGYSVSDMADDTIAAMRALRITQADLFGASQGGMMAQYMAIRAPELVRRLWLASTIARQNDLSRAVFTEWIRLAQAGDPVALNRTMFSEIYSPEFIAENRTAFDLLEREGSPAEMARLAVLAQACLDFDAYDEIGKIACPVCAVSSRRDRALSPLGVADFVDRLGCESYLYDGYSHAVYDEAPDYRDRMLRFFAAE